jgi:hypothetical protein
MNPEARANHIRHGRENFRTLVPVAIEKLRERYGGTKNR